MWRQMWIGLLASINVIVIVNCVAVISVDLGTEWIKVGIVSPGVPMEIVLNKESKRKTPAAIAFRNGERFFGEDALTLGVRFPQMSYSYILPLLGQRANSSIVQEFKTRFPYYQIEEDPERGTVVFKHDEELSFTAEELIAMFLQQAKKDAEISSRQLISEVVLTVPPYFSQAARRSLLSAVSIAGLKPLQLINDYLSVAVNYGIFRRKDFNETAQNILFYDMGASSTSASIVSFSVGKGRDADPQATVLGVGVDRTLGGLEMQLRLRDYLGRKFNDMKKTPNDVFKNPRALAKLFKEAGRVKNVLSANVDHYAQIEGLLDEKDFKLQVTRDQFEDLCDDLFVKVTEPVHKALKVSGLTMQEISQFVLVGAGTRVPKVQEMLTSKLGVTLSKNINADEAAAMGAVYKAADLSAGFKVKRFITKDAVLHPIQIVFDRKVDTEGTDVSPIFKTVKKTLFGLMNQYPQKKLLTFNRHSQNFNFTVNYAELTHLSDDELSCLGTLNLSRFDLEGLPNAIEKHQGPNVEAKGVKAHFLLDESGILHLIGSEMNFEKSVDENEEKAKISEEDGDSTLSKLGSTISKLFSSDDDTKKEEASAEKPLTEESKSSTTPAPQAENNETVTETPKVKILLIKESLTVHEEKLDLLDLVGKGFTKSKKKLDDLDEIDKKRKQRESSLDALESFILDTRMRLETNEFIEASSDTEKEAINKVLSSAADWLEDEGFNAETNEFQTKLKELKVVSKSVYSRVDEHKNRPEALAALEKIIEGSEKFLIAAENQSMHAVDTDDKIFTDVEITTLTKTITETKEWKDKKEKEQASVPLSQDPKLTVKSIAEKMAVLDREVKYLVNKAKIWRPKKKPEKDNSTEDASVKNGTDASDSENDKTEERNNANTSEELPESSPQVESTRTPEEKSEEADSKETAEDSPKNHEEL